MSHCAQTLCVIVGLAGSLISARLPAQAQSLPPDLKVQVIGGAQTLFDWNNDRCDDHDTPDAPARAFRDRLGAVHLVAAQSELREFRGNSLDTLKRDCQVIYQSINDDRPEMYSDRQWLAAPYTVDGDRIYGLVHEEYDGYLRPQFCTSQRYSRCWANAITLLISADGGRSYFQPKAPANLVAALPYKYAGDVGFPVGYFQPSNIVESNGYYYVLFRAAKYLGQAGGLCIMRTNDLSRTDGWRAWSGKSFSIQFVDPYTVEGSDPSQHLCAPLQTDMPWNLGGVAYEPRSGAFILVAKGLVGNWPPQDRVIGIWAAASYNLIKWSTPVLVLADPSGAKTYGDERETDQNPSLLDPTSTARNFDTIEKDPYVYFTRSNPDRRPYDRRLVRVPLRLTVNSK